MPHIGHLWTHTAHTIIRESMYSHYAVRALYIVTANKKNAIKTARLRISDSAKITKKLQWIDVVRTRKKVSTIKTMNVTVMRWTFCCGIFFSLCVAQKSPHLFRHVYNVQCTCIGNAQLNINNKYRNVEWMLCHAQMGFYWGAIIGDSLLGLFIISSDI